MKTYWEHSEQERSKMTEEDVRLLLDVELMKEGVKKPVAPKLAEVPNSPLGSKTKVFSIEGKSKYGSDEALHICFKDAETAQKFIDLCPMKTDYDYEVGSEFRYCFPIKDPRIVGEEHYTLDQINEFRSQLKQRKALSEENQRLQSEFNKASEKAEKVTEGIWKDWYAQCAKTNELKGIVETYQNYLTLTKDDVGMALTFLEKIHNQQDIQQAREWFPNSIPTEAPPIPVTEPAINQSQSLQPQ